MGISRPDPVAPAFKARDPVPLACALTSTAGIVSGSHADIFTNVPPVCPLATPPINAEVPLAPPDPQPPLPPQCPLPTPINLAKMLPFLNSYPDRQDASVLINGFTFGFRLGYDGPRVSSSAKNLMSVRDNWATVQEKIDREVHLGRIAGPYSSPPLPNLRCSPIGVVPKQTPGQFRLIHNLSSPLGSSVNDHIDPSLTAVNYTSFDDAISMLSTVGRGALMAKSDIKSAFRLLPVHPDDFNLLGFTFDGSFYYDKCMPMGCSISCVTFERFSTFLEYCACKVAQTRKILV